jgi:hypothetical protein
MVRSAGAARASGTIETPCFARLLRMRSRVQTKIPARFSGRARFVSFNFPNTLTCTLVSIVSGPAS